MPNNEITIRFFHAIVTITEYDTFVLEIDLLAELIFYIKYLKDMVSAKPKVVVDS